MGAEKAIAGGGTELLKIENEGPTNENVTLTISDVELRNYGETGDEELLVYHQGTCGLILP